MHATQSESVLPLAADVFRFHRVGGPEELEDVGLVDELKQASHPLFA